MGRLKERSRNSGSKFSRKRNSKIFIVCEGKETEINYFLNFRQRYCDIQIIPIESQYKDAAQLVKYAEKTIKIKNSEYNPKFGDQIYCVFDCDNNKNQTLAEAEKIALKNGYQIIFSNPCFEIWYLYHFIDINSELENAQSTIKELKKQNRLALYEKNKDYYSYLLPFQKKAITRSKARIEELLSQKIEIIRRNSNPVTTVSELVSFLNNKIQGTKEKLSSRYSHI